MIRCENPGGNTTIVRGDKWELCFSYGLLVAVWDKEERRGYKTSRHHSVTTSRHVNRFEAECGGRLLPYNQEALANLDFALHRDFGSWTAPVGEEVAQ